MLWYIKLKFCIWLCLTVPQIKFDCRQFASIFVGVMPLLERKMMKYTVFPTFLLHALTYWAEILHMTLFYCASDQVWVSSIFIQPSSDGTYYCMVISVRVSVGVSIRVSTCLHVLKNLAEIKNLTLVSLNPDGGKLHFFTSLFSALVALTVFTPFSMEITQPSLPGSGVHK